MNHLFSLHIGVFLGVYFNDIILYSDTIEDHINHVKTVVDIPQCEKLYLSSEKLNFLVDSMKILGHTVDNDGIAMDPNKVDSVQNWKIPTNQSTLQGFLGAVSFLALDCPGIHIPMGALHRLTGSTVPWHLDHTEQRAFDAVKQIVQDWSAHHRITLNYEADAQPINLITDALHTGASGVISQGADIPTAPIITFWSGKFNTPQKNYPIHEHEVLAIIEPLKLFKPLLHGIPKFH